MQLEPIPVNNLRTTLLCTREVISGVVALLPKRCSTRYCAIMPISDTSQQSGEQKPRRSLADLHPDYSELELNEAHARLRRYFDLAWAIFVRLEREGKLDDLNLTASKVNPTVKPPNDSHP